MVCMARARMLATIGCMSDGRHGVCAHASICWVHDRWSAWRVRACWQLLMATGSMVGMARARMLATVDGYMSDGRHGA